MIKHRTKNRCKKYIQSLGYLIVLVLLIISVKETDELYQLQLGSHLLFQLFPDKVFQVKKASCKHTFLYLCAVSNSKNSLSYGKLTENLYLLVGWSNFSKHVIYIRTKLGVKILPIFFRFLFSAFPC